MDEKTPQATMRQSNFELLRIVAMFMVLLLHANFASLGYPSRSQLIADPQWTMLRIICESFCIVAVNLFVLISGWFGINPSRRGLAQYLFQIFFLSFAIYFSVVLAGREQFSFLGLKRCLYLASPLWFVLAYLALYVLSPVLNAFVAVASRRQFRMVLAAFYIFQTAYGWIASARFVAAGYSCFSFIGLYLLARYFRIYDVRLTVRRGWGIYILSVSAVSALVLLRCFHDFALDPIAYSNPFVVTGAVGLFFVFASWRLRPNRFINWLAASSFSVYIVHCNYYIFQPYFETSVRRINQNFPGLCGVLLILALCLLTYLLVTLLDQIRCTVRHLIFSRLFRKKYFAVKS